MSKNGSKNTVFRSFLYKNAQNRAFLIEKHIKKTAKIKEFGLKRTGCGTGPTFKFLVIELIILPLTIKPAPL